MIVALTAYNRPDYLERMLLSLNDAVAETPEAVLVAAMVDPSDEIGRVEGLIASMLPRRGTYVTSHAVRVGHVVNIREAFTEAFRIGQHFGEDFAMNVQDDYELAPDAFACAAWMRDKYRDSERVICTALHREKRALGPDEEMAIRLIPSYGSQGLGTWRHRWPLFLAAWETVTTKREFGVDPPGYKGVDASIAVGLFRGSQWLQAAPCLPRVRHFGRVGGMHTTAATFEDDLPLEFAGDTVLPEHGYFEA